MQCAGGARPSTSRLLKAVSTAFAIMSMTLIGGSLAYAQTSTPGGYTMPTFGQPLHGKFDHNKTKFPLTGAHAQTSCEACHFNGQYKNTLYACPACHNGNKTIGKPPTHPPTSLKCAGCHETTIFSDIKVIDHTQASTKCAACHDGRIARGKSAQHIPTMAPCQSCHSSTTNFYIATKPATSPAPAAAASVPSQSAAGFNRRTVAPLFVAPSRTLSEPGPPARAEPSMSIGRPLQSSAPATGQPANSLSDATKASGRFDHMGASGPCMSCHDGRKATGKPSNHVMTAAPCETCHRGTTTFAGARFEHSVTGAACATCHNGRDATGKSPRHVLTSAPCDDCHKSKLSFGNIMSTIRSRRM